MNSTVNANGDTSGANAAPRGGVQWNSLRLLLQPRLEPSFGRLEAWVLALYAAVLAITVPFHEQWADEAQAWLIARDNSLWDIFYRRLHYEGSPGLWHLILWVATRLHLPYGSMNWISAALSAAGIYVWLRYSPFPTVIRLLFPLTFWLQYQFAVIARSYSATPLLAFSLCALFFLRRPRPVVFALLAGLMANLSMYAFLWSGSLALLYYLRLWSTERGRLRRSAWAGSGLVLCGLFLFAFYTAFPAQDLPKRHDGASLFARRSPLMNKLVPPTSTPPGWESAPELHPHKDSPFPPDDTLYTRGNFLQRAIMRALHPTSPNYRSQTWGHRLQRVIVPINAILYCISESNLLALALWVTCIGWLAMRRSLRTLLPLASMIALASLTKISDHHAGLILVSLITALWLTIQNPAPASRSSRLYPAMMGLLLAVFVEQVAWSAHAVAADIRQPYDPGIATAAYLREHAAGKRVIAFPYDTVSMVPFLPPHPFIDQPTSYWMWSSSVPQEKIVPVQMKTHPDFIVVSVFYIEAQHISNQIVPESPVGSIWTGIDPRDLAGEGYQEVARFCGTPFMRSGAAVDYCNAIYARSNSLQPALESK